MPTNMTDYGDPYVELRNDNLYIRGTRVQFESIILRWLQGRAPEQVQHAYPSVRLAAVYGAIAFYLDHQEAMDAFLVESHAEWERQRAASEAADPERYAELRRRFAEARTRRPHDDTIDAPETGASAAAETSLR